MNDPMEGSGEIMTSGFSAIVVVVNIASNAPLVDILVESDTTQPEVFAFEQTVPPGNVGEACCVRSGVYDLTFGFGGENPTFMLVEDQELGAGMENVYTITVNAESFEVDEVIVRERS